MVQKLEAVKVGEGSIRVGAIGTISTLMARELESVESAQQTTVSHQDNPKTIPVSVLCGVNTPKRQPRRSLNEASSSCMSAINLRNPETSQKKKSCHNSTHRLPMLRPDNVMLERTPSREKTNKKVLGIVEVVDIKCGNPDKAWASPLTRKLKKLGFSKLSESIF